jgi:endonuclease/exonuclease/phosphatase family metal-dependent hydrolase
MATIRNAAIDSADPNSQQIERGSFATQTQPDPGTKLIIATYNIRYAVGSFLISGSLLRRVGLRWPARRPRLVSKNIQKAARVLNGGGRMPRPDIVALQEADKSTARAGGIHVARELARELHMNYAHASLKLPRDEEPKSNKWYLDFEQHIDRNDPGDTGLAMLSRLPLDDVSRLDLPWAECAWRPRMALETIVRMGGQQLRIYNAHIDPHAGTDEQLHQHAAIIKRAGAYEGPTILLGDFNTLTSESRVRMRGLLESHGYTTPFVDGTATCRAGPIRLHTDWIFVRGARITRHGVARSRGVSDHWPVWAEIDLSDKDSSNG